MTTPLQPSGFAMQPRLRKKVTLITGAVGGIGSAVVQRFVEEGALAVVLTDLNQKALDASVEQFQELAMKLARASGSHEGPEVQLRGMAMDVTKESDVEAVFDAVVKEFGRVDVVVANAGIGAPTQPIDETSLELLEKMMKIHVHGVWLTTKHAAKSMKSGIRSGVQAGGSIVINSSVAALLGAPDFTPYIASKWGARGVGLAAAVELAPLNIRVNNVHPSLVKTPLLDACWTPEQAKEIESSIGLRRAAEPIEIANVILFLASDESSYMAAATVGVHGGHVV